MRILGIRPFSDIFLKRKHELSDYLSDGSCSLFQMHEQRKHAVFGFELIVPTDLIAERRDRARTESMTVLRVLRDTVLIELHTSGKAVSHHNDKLRLAQYLDFQRAFVHRQLFAGVNSIFNGIGQSCGKFAFTRFKGVRERKTQLQIDADLLRLFDVHGQNGIDDGAVCIANDPGRLQIFFIFSDDFQQLVILPCFGKAGDSFQLMAVVMPLFAEAFICRAEFVDSCRNAGNLQAHNIFLGGRLIDLLLSVKRIYDMDIDQRHQHKDNAQHRQIFRTIINLRWITHSNCDQHIEQYTDRREDIPAFFVCF